jgi:LacI family transcriptional regulator
MGEEMDKKPTMKEIAKRLNISINAVSLALNNKTGIGKEMRSKILNMADEIRYFENKPKYEKNYSNNNLCLILQSKHFNDFHFYSKVILGIEEEVNKNNFDLIFVFVDRDEYKIPACILNRKVCGALILGVVPNSFLKEMVNSNIPLVLVDNETLEFDIDSVATNNRSGTYKACQYLFGKNIFDIGFFGDIGYSSSVKERFSGIKEALLMNYDNYSNMINYLLKRSIIIDLEESIILKDTQIIIKKLKEIEMIPKAFICSNDNAAIILINALSLMGYAIPEDVSVIGFDNIDLCKMITPNLTTINVDRNLMGKKAVRKLIFKINDPNRPAEQTIMNVELVVRESTM